MAGFRNIRVFAVLVCAVGLFSGCDRLGQEPIRIGFVGSLTGRNAAVAIAAREGALLAVDEVNRAGGIDGRQVELIIKDIRQDGAIALQAVGELVAAGVPAIIGPMTSSMALVLAPAVNNTNTVMISPTASTRLLGDKDDNFFRLRPQCDIVASRLAEYIVRERKLTRIAVILDTGNSTYTHDWNECFTHRLTELGGENVVSVAFDSREMHSFSESINRALTEKPEGILLLANSLDTAMLSQQLMKQGAALPTFASEWSMTRDLLTAGGRSTEGMAMYHVFNESSRKQRYLEFKKRYQGQFKQEVSFPLVHAYDATWIALAGLKDGATTGPELKKFFLRQDSFDTLQSTLRFNRTGDVDRELFLTIVKEGAFVVVE